MAGKKEIKLVPTEEQPYEIPENWCWVRMRDLYVINPKNSASDDLQASFVPMERIAPGMVSDFTYEVQPWGKAKKGHTQFADGDVAFAKISPCFENRKSMMVNGLENGIGAGTTELIILRQPLVDQAYTFWIVSDDRFIQGGNQTYSGTVGQQRISMDYVRDYPVPLAPLAEQKRIVDTIVDLFADLDKVAENAQKIVDTYEHRRAAILADAFVGNLTEQWRNENNIGYSSWTISVIGDIADVKGGKRVPKGMSLTSENTGHPYIKAGNLKCGTVIDDGIMFVPDDVLQFIKNYTVSAGDVYITNVGACIGDCGVIPLKYDGANLTENAVKMTNLKCNGRFLAYFLATNQVQGNIKALIASATLGKLSIANIKTIEVNLPTLDEQQEIVRILDELLGNEQRIKEAAEEMLDKIAMMKKSILADAFRGKLGTNDPADEPATELLRQILA